MAADGDLLERAVARGWRVTPQRRAVAGVLVGTHVHLTAEEIHAAAQRNLPELSLATVYNSLNELVAMGEVGEVRGVGASVRYDPNVHQLHHHLVCERCGLIMDVQPGGIEGLHLTADERHGFVVGSTEVVFRGVCSRCAERSGLD